MKHTADLPSSPWAEKHQISISQWWTEYASFAHIDRLPAAAVRNLFVRSELPTEMLAHVRALCCHLFTMTHSLFVQVWEVSKVQYRQYDDTDHVSLVRIEFEIALLALSLSQSGLTPSLEVLDVALDDTSIAMPAFSQLPQHGHSSAGPTAAARPPSASFSAQPAPLVSPIVQPHGRTASHSRSAAATADPMDASRLRSASMPQLHSDRAVSEQAPAGGGGQDMHTHEEAPFVPWDPFGSQAGISAPENHHADPFASSSGVGSSGGGVSPSTQQSHPAEHADALSLVASKAPQPTCGHNQQVLMASQAAADAPWDAGSDCSHSLDCSGCSLLTAPVAEMALHDIKQAKQALWERLQEIIGREYQLEHS